jgi:hypothetical protein
MSEYELSDEQWCLLDLLMRAREKGLNSVSRIELLHSALPQEVAIKLVWAALTLPKELLEWENVHNMVITEEGVSLYNLRFGKPTEVADWGVICLPGPDVSQSN